MLYYRLRSGSPPLDHLGRYQFPLHYLLNLSLNSTFARSGGSTHSFSLRFSPQHLRQDLSQEQGKNVYLSLVSQMSFH